MNKRSDRPGLTWALDDNLTPYPVDLATERGAQAFEETLRTKKIVSHDSHTPAQGDYRYLVSTVFLGIDHCFGGMGPPMLYETMVFAAPKESSNAPENIYGGECEWRPDPADDDDWHEQVRYSSRAAAILGHGKALNAVRNGRVRKADRS